MLLFGEQPPQHFINRYIPCFRYHNSLYLKMFLFRTKSPLPRIINIGNYKLNGVVT